MQVYLRMDAIVIRENHRVVTQKELNIIKSVADGLKPTDIAEEWGMSGRTIEAILGGLRKDFECRSTTQLVATFLRKKLIK